MLLLLLVWLATNATNLFLGRMSLFQVRLGVFQHGFHTADVVISTA